MRFQDRKRKGAIRTSPISHIAPSTWRTAQPCPFGDATGRERRDAKLAEHVEGLGAVVHAVGGNVGEDQTKGSGGRSFFSFFTESDYEDEGSGQERLSFNIASLPSLLNPLSVPSRVTPAIEARIADHVWEIEELVALLD